MFIFEDMHDPYVNAYGTLSSVAVAHFSVTGKLIKEDFDSMADEALKIAAELGTTVEYLLTGKEASSINIHDIRLFGIARKWQSTVEDLETLSPEVATQLSLTIHVAAGQGKMLIEETGTER